MRRRIAVGDIHGCYQTLKYLLESEIKVTTQDRLFFLGDYVNKGPSSLQVIQYLLQLAEAGYDLTFLKGNHDQLLEDFLNDQVSKEVLLARGGYDLLQELDLSEGNAEQVLSFLNQLEYFSELSDFWLVHGGFNFDSSDPFTDFDSMLNIRRNDANNQALNGKPLIHGHVPQQLGQLQDQVAKGGFNELSIDTGCVYMHPGMGYLSAFNLDSQHLYHCQRIDKLFHEFN